MADETIPMKIKTLFSSFLAKEDTPLENNDSQKKDCEIHNRNIDQSNDARNRVLYYDRVETYSALTWFAKPLELSPLVCARYGWVNVDTDMLQCINCKTFLCASLPKHVDAFSYKESCKKLKNGLIDSHLKVCKWSKNPCPEMFATLPIYNQVELLEELVYRTESLSSLRCPYVCHNSLEKHGVSEANLHNMISTIFSHWSDDRKPTQQSAVLALTGWSNCGSQLDLLQCSYCRRKLGLWNYKQNLEEERDKAIDSDNTENANNNADKSSGKHGNNVQSTDDDDDNDEPRVKRIKLEKVTLDPVIEHRYWCPWVQLSHHIQSTDPCHSPHKSLASPNADTSEKYPAWLVVAKLLSRSADTEANLSQHIRQSPKTESLHHVRQVLRGCTSPKSAKRQILVSPDHPSCDIVK